MTPSPMARSCTRSVLRSGALVLIAGLASPCGGTAQAQGRLDASYVVTLSSVPIGKGGWTIDIADDQYTATASGATSGLLRVFALELEIAQVLIDRIVEFELALLLQLQ